LNSALFKLRANTSKENPIINAWLNVDGTYAILEFRTPEDAENSFVLSEVAIAGQVFYKDFINKIEITSWLAKNIHWKPWRH